MLPDPLVSAAPLFYRYQGPAHLDRLEAMVRTSAVYVPTAHQLNDPLDGRPRIAPMTADQLVAALQQGERALYPDLGAIEIDRRMVMIDINVRKHGAADILRRFSDGFHRTVAQTRILSMSRRWNNFAMWANYAANHAGYCLELANEGLFAEAREVSYYATAPLLDIGEINAGTAGWMFVKSQDWSNEEEIRLVVPRVLGGPLISYAPELLRRIIVGHFMHPPRPRGYQGHRSASNASRHSSSSALRRLRPTTAFGRAVAKRAVAARDRPGVAVGRLGVARSATA